MNENFIGKVVVDAAFSRVGPRTERRSVTGFAHTPFLATRIVATQPTIQTPRDTLSTGLLARWFGSSRIEAQSKPVTDRRSGLCSLSSVLRPLLCPKPVTDRRSVLGAISHFSSANFKSTLPQHAFTLIELIGVLAIIAIMAALMAPAVIRQIDEAARSRERMDLVAISNAVVMQVLSTRTIPHENNLAQSAAEWIRQPVAKVATTPRGFQRAFLLDNSGWFATRTSNPLYVQGNLGTAPAPNNARIIIVSTIARALPVATGRPSTVAFNAIWNTAAGQMPTGWTWDGEAEDLLIERINLDPIFHHLVLVNRDPPGNARYSIDSTTSVQVTNVFRSFYLNGTDLGLYNNASPPLTQARAVLDRDRSFVFQAGQWAGNLDDSGGGYTDVVGNEFAALAGNFLATEWYTNAHKGGNQQGAVVGMFNFMLTFQMWADQCPHFPTRGEARNNVPEYVLLLDMAGGGVSSLLNSFTGTDGLLKK